jgi:hypothetical protein
MQTILARIFTKPFLVTILRYALVAAGAWLASNTGFDPGTWETISGALMVIVIALMGGADSVKDKAVIDGKSVAAENLPTGVRKDLETAVDNKKGRSVIDMLFGK